MNIASILGAIATVVFIVWAWQRTLHVTRDVISLYASSGNLGSTNLYLLQILQTVVPIIQERSLVLLVVYIYGNWIGNIYNYIGIVIGSIIAFYLTRQYGQQFVKSMVSEHTYNRYINWLDKGQWLTTFAFMMFFPVSPDDFLMYASWFNKDDL